MAVKSRPLSYEVHLKHSLSALLMCLVTILCLINFQSRIQISIASASERAIAAVGKGLTLVIWKVTLSVIKLHLNWFQWMSDQWGFAGVWAQSDLNLTPDIPVIGDGRRQKYFPILISDNKKHNATSIWFRMIWMKYPNSNTLLMLHQVLSNVALADLAGRVQRHTAMKPLLVDPRLVVQQHIGILPVSWCLEFLVPHWLSKREGSA